MTEEGSIEFRLRKIAETRNYLSEKITHNDLMNKKYKKICKYLNYVEHLVIIDSTITGCVSISAFSSLVCVHFGIASSAIGIKICPTTARIKKYKSIIKKRIRNMIK